VAIPDLKPGATTDVWLYYGNPKAVAAEDVKGTYDGVTKLVYHFAEQGQPPRDSSAWGNHAQSAGVGADGAIIGRGLRLDGTNGVVVPSGPSLAWTAGTAVTWSAWVKPAEAESTGVLFSRRDGASAFVVGLDGGKPYVELGSGAGPQRAAATAAIAASGWHHLAITAGQELALYVDGAPAAKLAAAIPALDTTSDRRRRGAAPRSAAGGARARSARRGPGALPGSTRIDELQIASVSAPPASSARRPCRRERSASSSSRGRTRGGAADTAATSPSSSAPSPSTAGSSSDPRRHGRRELDGDGRQGVPTSAPWSGRTARSRRASAT
jgi:biopolymer transport protein ExbB